MVRLSILDDTQPGFAAPGSSFSLRVSVLEQCQYNCPYCLPGTVRPYTHRPSWLTGAEYRDIAKMLSHFPVTKVRFTGGEPLIRPNLPDIIRAFRDELPGATLAITTNGQLLEQKWQALVQSGVSRLNVHIDSLNSQKYRKVMGNGDVDKIVALVLQLRPHFEEVKINLVLQKGINDDELCDFLLFSARHKIEVRFIELMDTGSAADYVKSTFLEGADAVRIIERTYAVTPAPRKHVSDAASLYNVPDLGISFGLIASDTQPFCDNCNRIRLTAQGELRGCLYEPRGLPLGALLREGNSISQLLDRVNNAVLGKRSFHPLTAREKYSFSMAEIGG